MEINNLEDDVLMSLNLSVLEANKVFLKGTSLDFFVYDGLSLLCIWKSEGGDLFLRTWISIGEGENGEDVFIFAPISEEEERKIKSSDVGVKWIQQSRECYKVAVDFSGDEDSVTSVSLIMLEEDDLPPEDFVISLFYDAQES